MVRCVSKVWFSVRTLVAPKRDWSRTSVTSQARSFMTASGVTAPCLTPSFSSSTAPSAKRKLAFAIPRSDGSFFRSIAQSAAAVRRKSPAFLSLTKRFFAKLPPELPTAFSPASTVSTGSCSTHDHGIDCSRNDFLTALSAASSSMEHVCHSYVPRGNNNCSTQGRTSDLDVSSSGR